MHTIDLSPIKMAINHLIESRIDDFCKTTFSLSAVCGVFTVLCIVSAMFSFPREYYENSSLHDRFTTSKLIVAPTMVFAPLWYLFHRFENSQKKLVKELKSLLIELSNRDYTRCHSKEIINTYFDSIINAIKAHPNRMFFADLMKTLRWDKKKLSASN